jgi:enamine deaminase RidA (YjgF/YER057c/UK114 family)
MPAAVASRPETGLGTLSVTWIGPGEAYLVTFPRPGDNLRSVTGDLFTEIGAFLRGSGLTAVRERIFGCLSAKSLVMSARSSALTAQGLSPEGPVAYLEGRPTNGSGLAGVIVHAVPAGCTWTIRDRGLPAGRGWRRGGTTFLSLQDLDGTGGRGRAEQTSCLFSRAERLLAEQGASFRDVVRTWFTLEEILDWYAEFNRARSDAYDAMGLMPRADGERLLLPASTGVGGRNAGGGALSMDLMAVLPSPESSTTIEQISNPRQMDAFRYGASFSRGALIVGGGNSLLQLSGTAAVDAEGRSLFPGDVRSQIDWTLDTVEALLESRGAHLADMAAATVYVKSPAFAPVFWELAARRGLADLPAVCVVADICREELLFEIDGEVAFIPGLSRSRLDL